MPIPSAKKFAVLLLIFLTTTPPTTAELQSETPSPSPTLTPSPFNKTCSLYSILTGKCVPQLSFAFMALSLVYLSFFVYWISVCVKIKQSYRRIYFLMGGLILIKAATLIYNYYHETVKLVTGIHGSDISDLLFFVYRFISGVRVIIVLQLIVSAWYFVEPFLQQIDKIVLMILIPLQVLGNIADIVIGENVDWKNLNDMLILVDLISGYLMLFPLISSLVSMIIDGIDGLKKDNKLTGIRSFYSIVILKLLFMGFLRMVRNNYPFQMTAIDADEYLLRCNVGFEMYSLLFYMVMFDMFRKLFADLVDQDEGLMIFNYQRNYELKFK